MKIVRLKVPSGMTSLRVLEEDPPCRRLVKSWYA